MINKKCKNELEMFKFDFNGYNGTSYLMDIKHLTLDWNTIL